ncbi:MAG: hypothetical protein Q8P67_16920 [archaeon]|nr:hypothetical protein [archaeon]
MSASTPKNPARTLLYRKRDNAMQNDNKGSPRAAKKGLAALLPTATPAQQETPESRAVSSPLPAGTNLSMFSSPFASRSKQANPNTPLAAMFSGVAAKLAISSPMASPMSGYDENLASLSEALGKTAGPQKRERNEDESSVMNLVQSIEELLPSADQPEANQEGGGPRSPKRQQLVVAAPARAKVHPSMEDMAKLHRKCWELELRSRTQAIKAKHGTQALRKEVALREARIGELGTSAAAKDERIQQLRTQLGELREVQEADKTAAAGLQSRIEHLEGIVNSQEVDVDHLRQRSSQYQEELAAHVRRIGELLEEHVRLETAVQTGRDHIQSLTQMHEQLQSRCGQKEAALKTATAGAESLKRSYFNAIALAIKMDLSLKREISDSSVNLQELYELASVQCVAQDDYPAWISKQFEGVRRANPSPAQWSSTVQRHHH